MTRVGIGLGSNLGDRLGHLQRGLDLVARVVTIESVSSVYETAAMYVTDQPAFLNSALIGLTDLGPLKLLQELKSAEDHIGRQFRDRYGPREIDLDLLAYGSIHLESEGPQKPLIVPHALIAERRFVLEPLYEIDPFLVLPNLGPVSFLLSRIESAPQDVVICENATLSIHGERRQRTTS